VARRWHAPGRLEPSPTGKSQGWEGTLPPVMQNLRAAAESLLISLVVVGLLLLGAQLVNLF
jgi:hypothetical protein